MAKKTLAGKRKTTKAAAKKKVAVKSSTSKAQATASDKKAALQKQIEALQGQMVTLQREAIHKLKLKLLDARKVVSQLEAELDQLTGKSSGTAKIRRERRPSISDEILKDQILKAMAADGKLGMNARHLSEKVGQDALRIRKFIAANLKFLKRTGNGAGTKFFLP